MIDLPESKVRSTPTSKQPRQIKWWTDWVLLVPFALVLAVDQISKYFVKSNLMLGESWPREGIFRITYGTNSGSIFGLFPNQTGLLIVASFVAIGFLVYFYKKHALSHPITRLSVGLLLGGAFGNLIDRVGAGTVVDFIDLGWWPIFNMADSSIVVGIILLVSTMVLTESKRYDHPDVDMSNKADE